MIINISFSLNKGGAAIAARKFVRLQNRTNMKHRSINQDGAGKLPYIKRLISYIFSKSQYDDNPIKHSLNLFSYPPVLKSFSEQKSDIFHIHWINNDTISIFNLKKIPSGSIITLHDEWLYCGSEHVYNIKNSDLDFITGYNYFKKNTLGIHWNYIIWKVKINQLQDRTDLIYTVPSRWMLERAQKSILLKNSDVRLLPNIIDTETFIPISMHDCSLYRTSLEIEDKDILLVLGASSTEGKSSVLKGFHLMSEALELLCDMLPKEYIARIKLIDFGGKAVRQTMLHGIKLFSVGHISTSKELATLYSSADCVVIPSMVESFGQIAAEALACETPVICFNYSGLTDIVIDGITGFTAEPYSSKDLAEKIKEYVLLDKNDQRILSESARRHIVNSFSYPVIEEQYKNIISDAIKLKKLNEAVS